MMELYFAASGNSLRVVAMLEECGADYVRHKIDLENGEQRSPKYLRINSSGTVPVLHDAKGEGGSSVWLNQSGAIMIYLAEKFGMLFPTRMQERIRVLQWFTLAVSDVGPANAMILYMNRGVADLSDTGKDFLVSRFIKHIRVVENHLKDEKIDYLAGKYSIADLALFPAVRIRREVIEKTGEFTHILKWADRIQARPAVERAILF